MKPMSVLQAVTTARNSATHKIISTEEEWTHAHGRKMQTFSW